MRDIIVLTQATILINTLKPLAKFDTFIAGHIAKYADKGRGSVSYLSSTIADGFIAVIANEITDTIVVEVKKAKYYSISVDSSLDISHVDQLVVMIRYIHPNRHEPVECFLTFIPIFSHTGESLANVTLELLHRFLLHRLLTTLSKFGRTGSSFICR